MSLHDLDFLLELQRHAVEEGQHFLAGRLVTLLEARIEEEKREGRLTPERLIAIRLRFRQNLALVRTKVDQVGRLLSRLKGDHERLASIWVQ